tara:strand:- start:23548 stop:23844 length:297 start_codon:yes stop_codon:yes gene_type:complete
MTTKPRNITEPNPLNFFGVRQVRTPPPHFESMTLEMSLYNLEGTMTKWIIENLKGRFYIGDVTALDSNNQFQRAIKVAFEQPKELSYFTLACPFLKYK